MRTTSRPRRIGLVAAPRRRVAGVTLIELMIVVVVVAVLGLIALPSYREYARRANRSEAKSALLQIQTNQERWYLQNNSYTTNLGNVGFAGGQTESGFYTLAITTANAQTFTATATPTAGGGMADDAECAQFSINAQGVRAATPDTNGRCW